MDEAWVGAEGQEGMQRGEAASLEKEHPNQFYTHPTGAVLATVPRLEIRAPVVRPVSPASRTQGETQFCLYLLLLQGSRFISTILGFLLCETRTISLWAIALRIQ